MGVFVMVVVVVVVAAGSGALRHNSVAVMDGIATNASQNESIQYTQSNECDSRKAERRKNSKNVPGQPDLKALAVKVGWMRWPRLQTSNSLHAGIEFGSSNHPRGLFLAASQ